MTETRRPTARRAALGVALETMPAPATEVPVAVLPVTAAQWERSLSDADLDGRAAVYTARRLDIVSTADRSGTALGRRLRPAALELARAARDLCERLETLGALEPDGEASRTAHAWRDLVAKDARAVVTAAIDEVDPPPNRPWPALPSAAGDDRDILLALFGIAADELTDDSGSFSDVRVLAHYGLRLVELQQLCDPILALVADRPPSVFTAVSAARDLATSASPFVTLRSARDIRARILGAFAADAARTIAVFADAAREMDKEWSSFVRVRDRLRRAEAARTERDRAVSVLEAYKHMAEGITRRWVWLLLRLTGLDGSLPTVGVLGEPAAARLGELGARIESALVPAMRNAEAHEDFEFDEDTGLLVVGDATFHPDDILARLTELDILQRALIVGRLAAFADQPALAGGIPGSPGGPSASSMMAFARQRFGHAGQRVRSFDRDRDRLDVVIDGLRPEACNPCFLALTQAAQVLPTVGRFVVRLPGREDPVIDLPASVLHTNWPVLELAARFFPDALPQVTFLPCLTWVWLSCEPVEEATRGAAWMALNDAQHAIVDAEAAPRELVRLPDHLRLVDAAAAATVRLLPQGPHVDALLRAGRMTRTTARAVSDSGPHDITTNVLMDGILRARDRLGGPPAVLPTLDATPLRERSYPHDTS
jgi:hypothetical protein